MRDNVLISLTASLFLISLLGLRLRALLGEAVFAKTLRMRQGGGTSGSDDKTDDGAPSLGNANNLVSTDIDTITSSLETSLQLLAIPFKLIVALIYLYVLLGWSAFVALAVIVLFTPLSGWVSSRYGAVQGKVHRILPDLADNADHEARGSAHLGFQRGRVGDPNGQGAPSELDRR